MQKNNLGAEIRDHLREQVIVGKLPPNSRLNEVHLARELEVSRTPLREALFGLVNEKLLVEIPRRGFFVAKLSVEEIKQLYAIRQILDPAALKLAGIPDDLTMKALRTLNKKISKARAPADIIRLDDQWHLNLIEGCKNQILLDLICQHMVRTRRYELAYFSQSQSLTVATDEHTAILDALTNRKLASACKLLLQNMSSAEGPLIDWVRKQEQV